MKDIYKSRLYSFPVLQLKHPERTKYIVHSLFDDLKGVIYSSKTTSTMLYEIAIGFHSIPPYGYCIEFGTCKGGSSVIIGRALKERGDVPVLPLVTIDHHRTLEAPETIARLELQKYISLVLHDDMLFFESVLKYISPIQLMFYDSDHSEERTYKALKSCFPYLMDSGWLVIHDYVDSVDGLMIETIPAVNRFLDECCFDFKVYCAGDGTVAIQKLE